MSESSAPTVDERIFTLNVIELLAAIFRGPDAGGWDAIFTNALPDLLSRTPQGLEDITDSLRSLQDSRPQKSESPADELETEYVRLFVAGRGGVVAPLYESCHQVDSPRVMGDTALAMRTRLDAAELEVSLDSNEPPDHLSIELEYLYYQLGTAWREGNITKEQDARAFARDMLVWVSRFNDGLTQGEPHPTYRYAGSLAVQLLKHIGGE